MGTSVGAEVPNPYEGLRRDDVTLVKFRCPHCKMAHTAAVLQGSPLMAKFHCRQCEHTVEVQTRESAGEDFENRVDEAKDDGARHAKRREYSKNLLEPVPTRFGPAFLIG